MVISVFELFSVGIGPSSSHTVGPMRAARRFVLELDESGLLNQTSAVRCELYGSLAMTGKGHRTDDAVLLGLMGEIPEEVDPEDIDRRLNLVRSSEELLLDGRRRIRFVEAEHLPFKRKETLPEHPNGMRFFAFDEAGAELYCTEFFSIGGGFIVKADEQAATAERAVPYPFANFAELEQLCKDKRLRIDELMLKNECAHRTEVQVRNGLLAIWKVMRQSIERGSKTEGIIPGGLGVRRRAPRLYRALWAKDDGPVALSSELVSVWAMAVNEENAAGHRIVTAPTNGAAGTIPAVIRYYERFCEGAGEEGIVRFLLVAGAIGILYKRNASISAAEVGCQGEIGVACSMAAAGLTAAVGGSTEQIEDAAEIGMEHHLGLTCDPVGGLVQVPCIERNAMGAVKAITAMRLAMHNDASHKTVPLDSVIATMFQTGRDMQTIYKETSEGGLAVNVPEC